MNPLHLRPKYLCLYTVPLARTVQTTTLINNHTGYYCFVRYGYLIGTFLKQTAFCDLIYPYDSGYLICWTRLMIKPLGAT